MTISVTPSQSAALTVLGNYIALLLPSGVEIVVAQQNRVPEPSAVDFVVMNPIRLKRLETNIDSFVDAKFTGSIAAYAMTITHVFYGVLKTGSVIFGVGVTNGTQILSQTSGTPGGVGVYAINNSQSVNSETLAAGVMEAMQPSELVIQLDAHGPNGGNNAQIISTMIRDDHAVQYFKTANSDISPLYADDPKQIPFLDDQNQFEDRWIIEACLEVNATVNDIPQQFFDQIVVTFIPADIVEPV